MIPQQFSRNLGILSEEEMDKLSKTTIAIAGCGCIGGFSAELLARMGVGSLILADPDTFDLSNINRQCAATHLTIGQLKVEALKTHLLSINPDLKLVCYNQGINQSNVTDFVMNVDYVIDAIDYFSLPDSISLHRAARNHNLYIATAVALGFGTSVLTFSPDGLKLEDIIGISTDTPVEDLQGITIPASNYTRHLPAYATEDKIRTWLETKNIPTISIGQALGPGILVSQLVLHLLNRKQPKIVPDSIQFHLE
ncbi:MAG TPA: ThiF family adenylyltransferase [Bacilli bacterium]